LYVSLDRTRSSPIELDLRHGLADRIILVGVTVAVLLAFGQILTQVIDAAALGLRVTALNSDSHRSVFGVVSLGVQAATGVAVGLRCLTSPRRGWWLVLAALVGVLLVVRALVPGKPAAFALPVAVAFVLFWWLTTIDYRRARTVVRVGLFVLAFSFVVHVVGPRIVDHLGYDVGSFPYELKGILKHSTELAGWALVGTGVLAGWCAGRQPSRALATSAALSDGRWPA
jgi:hypothetical protein